MWSGNLFVLNFASTWLSLVTPDTIIQAWWCLFSSPLILESITTIAHHRTPSHTRIYSHTQPALTHSTYPGHELSVYSPYISRARRWMIPFSYSPFISPHSLGGSAFSTKITPLIPLCMRALIFYASFYKFQDRSDYLQFRM